MSDTLNRTVYGRIFRGSHQAIAETGPRQLIGALFDRTNMPALVLDPGKQIYYDFTLDQNVSKTLALPENYDGGVLYIAVQADLKCSLVYSTPTHGSSTVLLKGTDTTTEGTHAAFWSYQGDMTSFAVSVPSTANGGATTAIQVFMYEMPDLTDYQNYFDQQIGYGVSGD